MSGYIKDNYDLWAEHDRLQEQVKSEIEYLDKIISDIEQALIVLEDDFDKGCNMLRDLVSRLEDGR
jgi:hypothetical protein